MRSLKRPRPGSDAALYFVEDVLEEKILGVSTNSVALTRQKDARSPRGRKQSTDAGLLSNTYAFSDQKLG